MHTTQLPLAALVPGRYYVGRGRHANVGLWNGDYFQTIGDKMGREVVKQEPYYTEESGCFQPFRELDEGRTIESVGQEMIWDRHYARVIDFGGEGDPPTASPLKR